MYLNRFIHGMYEGSLRMSLTETMRSYHTFHRFAMARIRNSARKENNVGEAGSHLERLLCTELYPMYTFQ